MEVLSDFLFERNSDNVQNENNWWSDINGVFEVSKEILGCMFLVKEICDDCNKSVFKKGHSL